MKGNIEFVDKTLITSEVKDIEGSLLEIKTPARKVDTVFNDYKEKGFESVDGFFKRVNLDTLLGENVSKVEESLTIDGNTSVADAGGINKNSDKKQVAFIRTYEKRQKARIPEIGK